MKERLFITTTLPYANAKPHIGHTLEFIQADVIARFFRKKLGKENVWFNVGTDENGLKNYQKAQEEGLSPKKYVDKNSASWKEFCAQYYISFDTFYRTSENYHIKPSQLFWQKSLENGDIYKKHYEGLYCVGCEEFKTQKDLVDGKCPDHGKEPIIYSEENYFFKLSKYKDELLKWLNNNPNVLKPSKKLDELKNWISEMEDISISRKKESLPWGIEVPNDPSQVMYVWFDALTNYTNVLNESFDVNNGEINEEREVTSINLKEGWWPGVQCFGPDNLRFQGAIWQGMLSSAGIAHTQKLLCHGTILGPDGTKMSKTKGNIISPFEQFDKYGAEAVRFYMIAALATFDNSTYKESDLVNIYNSMLANNFGNLVNRVVTLAKNKNIDIVDLTDLDSEFVDKVDALAKSSTDLFFDFELQEAVLKANEICVLSNEYITLKAPWNKEIALIDAQKTLRSLVYALQKAIEIYSYVIPQSSHKAQEMLANLETGVLFEKLEEAML